jgi:hypothetical protein
MTGTDHSQIVGVKLNLFKKSISSALIYAVKN